jgi:hypothetical protein
MLSEWIVIYRLVPLRVSRFDTYLVFRVRSVCVVNSRQPLQWGDDPPLPTEYRSFRVGNKNRFVIYGSNATGLALCDETS